MSLLRMIVIAAALWALIVALLFTATHLVITDIDQNGGLKSVVERVWHGEPRKDGEL